MDENIHLFPTAAGAAEAAVKIIDVDTMDFEKNVLEESLKTPVIVDFWAPWCGPCKQLMPVLEKAVTAEGGAVVLAKINIDNNPELAQAMQVQSVPTVLAFYQGQPIDGFMGAKPESEVTAFVNRVAKHGGGAPAADGASSDEHIRAFLDKADAVLDGGNWQEAQAAYAKVLQADPGNEDAVAGFIRSFIVAGKPEEARKFFDQVREKLDKIPPAIAALETHLELLGEAPEKDSSAIKGDKPQDIYDLAMVLFRDGRYEDSVEKFLDMVEKNKDWKDGQARKQLIRVFEALGNAHPVTVSGRRRLSSILFS